MPAASATPIQFFFVAVNAMGGRRVGMRAAPSEAALSEALRREQLLLLRSWRMPGWAGAGSDIPLKEQAALNEQLHNLLSRGVPLTEALDVGASVVSASTRERVVRMRDAVSSGASFAGACEQIGGFDAVAIAVYRSAERTGDLAGAAGRLAKAARRRLAIGAKAVTLLIYPCVVLAISVIAATVMLAVVVPQVGNALQQAGAKLPGYSKIVIGVGGWLKGHIVWVGLFATLAVTAGIALRKQLLALVLAGARRLGPVRRLQTSIEAARFFAVMGAMTRSGVPVADALGVAAMAVSEPRLRTQLDALRKRLVEGGVFRNLIEEVEALPLATRRLLVAAERAGDLDSAFDGVASDLADAVDTQSDRLLALLEPLLIVGMFLIIGSLLLAIMIPLITLSGQVGDL